MPTLVSLFIILGLAAMNVSKVVLQTTFGRKRMQTTADTVLYNLYMFLFAAVIPGLLLFTGSGQISPLTAAAGSAFGLLSVIFQLLYLRSLACGPVSLTILVVTFANIIPILYGTLFLGEPMTPLRAVAIVLVLAALVITTYEKDTSVKKAGRAWFFSVAVCFLTNGALMILQKYHQYSAVHAERDGFVLCAYLAASAASVLILLLFLRQRTEISTSMKGKVPILLAAGCGLILGLYQKLSLFMAQMLDAAFYYPALQCTVSLLSLFAGVMLFGDRLTRRQLAGTVLGIAALVILSI